MRPFLIALLLACALALTGCGAGEELDAASPTSSSEVEDTSAVFTLEADEFVTYEPGVAKPGDLVVCLIDGKRIETSVPPPNTGVSTDPMYVATKPDGSVRAECGGIHAETAPPGSW